MARKGLNSFHATFSATVDDQRITGIASSSARDLHRSRPINSDEELRESSRFLRRSTRMKNGQ
jgi:hypothetical protein